MGLGFLRFCYLGFFIERAITEKACTGKSFFKKKILWIWEGNTHGFNKKGEVLYAPSQKRGASITLKPIAEDRHKMFVSHRIKTPCCETPLFLEMSLKESFDLQKEKQLGRKKVCYNRVHVCISSYPVSIFFSMNIPESETIQII